jgi:hypothetical protein
LKTQNNAVLEFAARVQFSFARLLLSRLPGRCWSDSKQVGRCALPVVKVSLGVSFVLAFMQYSITLP